MASRTAVHLAASATADAGIECVAVEVSPTGQHVQVFAGTASGALLVYELPLSAAGQAPGAAPQLRLVAKRSLGRRPVEALCLLPAARTLAALCDSNVTLISTDTLDGVPLAAARGATFLTKDVKPTTGRQRLAVVLKRRVLVFELAPPTQGAAAAEAVQQPRLLAELEWPGTPLTLVWYWDGLLAGTRRGYFSMSLRSGASASEVCPLPPDSTTPPLLAALPPSGEAILLADTVGVIVSMAGVPRGNPVAFGRPPVALAHCPPHVLSLAPDRRSLDVWDRSTGTRIQQLSIPCTPAAGTGVSIGSPASLLIARPEVTPQQQSACAADDGDGAVIAVCAGRSLSVLLPVSLEAQVKELFRAKQYDACLPLVSAWQAATTPPDGVLPPPPPEWLHDLRAELGFLDLAQGRWNDAIGHWEACATFTAQELFPLFPELTAPFRASSASTAAPIKRYWGFHPPLSDLATIVRSSGQSGRLPQTAVQEATAAVTRLLERLCAQGGSRVQAENGGRESADTLLLLLYAQQGNLSAAEALAGDTTRAVLASHAVPLLAQLGCHLAVVMLHARAGEHSAALDVCAQLLSGQRTEAARPEAEVKYAAGAAAASLLERCEDMALVLRTLTWLLDLAPQAAEAVLGSASAPRLPAHDVLALLRPRGGAPLLTYLQALVMADPPTPQRELHTELGTLLIAAVAASRYLTAGDDTDSAARVRLRAFLGKSSQYDVQQLLQQLDTCGSPPLLRERVLMYALQGAHMQALTILVTQLGDCDAAENYAARQNSLAGRAEAHAALLHLYLRPPPGGPPTEVLYPRAARLLSSQADDVLVDGGAMALDVLPEDSPLEMLLQPLAGMLFSASHRMRTAAIRAGLARRQRQVVTEELSEAKAARVLLSEDTCCGVCHSRLGPPGEFRPFACFPGGLVACYRCAIGFKQTAHEL